MSASITIAAEAHHAATQAVRMRQVPSNANIPESLSSDQGHIYAMQLAFQSTGGLASGEEIALLLRRHAEQPLSQLARWIVKRKIVNFEWRAQTLIPLFQFNLHDMSIRPEVATLIAELAPALDAWELTRWFAMPNAWLDDQRPVDLMQQQLPAVVDAARADRYVATGWA